MSETIKPEVLAEYAEYFNVKENFTANVVPCQPDDIPSVAEFAHQIPELYKLAGDMLVLDQHQLRDLDMSERSAKLLAGILNQQSRRLSMVITYLLRHEDDARFRQSGVAYGGGGFTFAGKAAAQLELGHQVQVKLFLVDDYAAIFAYGQIIEIPSENHYVVAFTHIRDDDRELLVRSSLHAQTRQLKQRSDERRQSQSDSNETD